MHFTRTCNIGFRLLEMRLFTFDDFLKISLWASKIFEMETGVEALVRINLVPVATLFQRIARFDQSRILHFS